MKEYSRVQKMSARKEVDFTRATRWGIPDFSDPSSYPRTYIDIIPETEGLDAHDRDDAAAAAWKWEFLRRCKGYRRYYHFYVGLYDDATYEDYWHPVFRIRGTLPDPRKTYLEVPLHGLYEKCLPIPTVLSFNIDIAKSAREQVERLHDQIVRLQTSYEWIERQFAGRFECAAASRETITSKNRYVPFLRALDGRAVNATGAEIDRVLNNQVEGRPYQGKRNYEQAVKLQCSITGMTSPDVVPEGPCLLPCTFR